MQPSSVAMIDREVFLRMVFTVLFGTRQALQGDREYHVQCCTATLASESFEPYQPELAKRPSVSDAVKLYGATKIAKECIAFTSCPNIAPLGLLNVLHLFHGYDYPGVCRAFAAGGLHSAIAQGFWRKLRVCVLPYEEVLHYITDTVMMLSR